MKKTTIVIILVLVFIVIAVVAYMFMSSNKDSKQATTTTTTKTGLGNILGSLPLGSITGILNTFQNNNKTPSTTPAPIK